MGSVPAEVGVVPHFWDMSLTGPARMAFFLQSVWLQLPRVGGNLKRHPPPSGVPLAVLSARTEEVFLAGGSGGGVRLSVGGRSSNPAGHCQGTKLLWKNQVFLETCG
ncbi:Hypothetical predicted protein [Podarcis lilfordi]|uniref:Uncharacterized protein n=1 Tax=Podarcis lilfordi TaxID=74358 RepID=A0AA35PNN3_9SAUR|nr:Hypothetical predicted protein [Podarcis lilfordi]